MKRHTCIICKAKRYESAMKNVFFNSWACVYENYKIGEGYKKPCINHPDIIIMKEILELNSNLKLLNLSYLTHANNTQQIKLKS